MKSAIKKLIPHSLARRVREIWQQIHALFYYGDKYYCPFCENNFRKLLPGGHDLPVIKEKQIIGAGLRNNCVCPRCHSTDRDRLIHLYLTNFTSILSETNSLLHVAPSGSLESLLKTIPNLKYDAGIKYHEGFYFSKDIPIIDIRELKYKDQNFDIIICNHVLEHIKEDLKAMKELYRVMKPGGWGLLQVPISNIIDKTYEDFTLTKNEDREREFGQFDHVRIYGSDYVDRLIKAGFKVEIVNPSADWGLKDLDKYAINKNELLYIVHKN